MLFYSSCLFFILFISSPIFAARLVLSSISTAKKIDFSCDKKTLDTQSSSKSKSISSSLSLRSTMHHLKHLKVSSDSTEMTYLEEREKLCFEITTFVLNKYFPTVIGDIIKGYGQALVPWKALYESIMKGFQVSSKEQERLDFESEHFVLNLTRILSLRSEGFFKNEGLWKDLNRLLFKWMVYATQTFSLESEMRFKMTFFALESLFCEIRAKKPLNFPNYFIFDSKTGNLSLSLLQPFMQYEFLENPQVFRSLVKAIRYFYGTKDKENVSCSGLIKEHFGGSGNYDLLLKFAILMYDPQEEMRKCFPEEIRREIPKRIPFISNPTSRSFLKELETIGPKDIGIVDVIDMNEFMIDSFFKTKRQFRIRNSNELSIILNRFAASGVLDNIKSIKQVFRFETIRCTGTNSFFKWDPKIFNKYLIMERRSRRISAQHHIKFSKLSN